MQSLNSDFFIANGDMIYADGTCPEDGPILNDNINNQNSTWRNMPGDFKSIMIQVLIGIILVRLDRYIKTIGNITEMIPISKTFSKILLCILNGMTMR